MINIISLSLRCQLSGLMLYNCVGVQDSLVDHTKKSVWDRSTFFSNKIVDHNTNCHPAQWHNRRRCIWWSWPSFWRSKIQIVHIFIISQMVTEREDVAIVTKQNQSGICTFNLHHICAWPILKVKIKVMNITTSNILEIATDGQT